MAIILNKFTFYCRWLSEAHLPEYLGSTLRGSFGWALKKCCCALKRQACETCMVRAQCAYSWIFETERYQENTKAINARPHPFVLQPGDGASGSRRAEETWTFVLTLIGKGNDFLPHIIYSIEQMGEDGIGAALKEGYGRFVLEKVECNGEEIYNSDSKKIFISEVSAFLSLANFETQQIDSMRLSLQTPLRLKQQNSLQRELPFHVLIRAALRRMAALENAYGSGEPELDYSGLTDRAGKIQTVQADIKWRDLLRFSNRQRQKVSLSGLIGTAQYQGDLAEFLPLLKYTEQVNLGKQTVFGLGLFTVQFKQEGVIRKTTHAEIAKKKLLTN